MQLPDCGGIADVTTYHDRVYLYIPRRGLSDGHGIGLKTIQKQLRGGLG